MALRSSAALRSKPWQGTWRGGRARTWAYAASVKPSALCAAAPNLRVTLCVSGGGATKPQLLQSESVHRQAPGSTTSKSAAWGGGGRKEGGLAE